MVMVVHISVPSPTHSWNVFCTLVSVMQFHPREVSVGVRERVSRNERNLVRLAQKSQEINGNQLEINLRNHLKSLVQVDLPPTPPIFW